MTPHTRLRFNSNVMGFMFIFRIFILKPSPLKCSVLVFIPVCVRALLTCIIINLTRFKDGNDAQHTGRRSWAQRHMNTLPPGKRRSRVGCSVRPLHDPWRESSVLLHLTLTSDHCTFMSPWDARAAAPWSRGRMHRSSLHHPSPREPLCSATTAPGKRGMCTSG